MLRRIIIFFFCICCASFLRSELHSETLIQPYSKEMKATTAPDPIDLSPNWWSYFQTDNSELAIRIENFNKNLQTILQQVSEENRATVEELIEKININFRTLLQLKNQPIPSAPPQQPFAKSYSVSQVMALYRQIRVESSALKANKEELHDKKRQREAAQEHLHQLFQAYLEKKDPNEEKLIAGLQLVVFQTFSKLLDEQIFLSGKKIEIQEDHLKDLQDELKVASTSLKAEPKELNQSEIEMVQAKQQWEESNKQLKNKESRVVVLLSSLPQTDEAKLESQLVHQELTLATTEENIAQVNYISSQVEHSLISFLLNRKLNASQYNAAAKQWQKELNQIDDESVGAEKLLQREIQRIEEVLSFAQQENTIGLETTQILGRKIRKQAQDTLLLIQRLSYEIDATRFLVDLLQKKLYSDKNPVVRWFYGFFDTISEASQSISSWINQVLFYIGTTPVTFLSIIQFLVIILAAIWVSRLVLVGLTEIAIRRKGIKKSLLYRLNRLVHYTILAIGLIIALSFIGFDFSNLVLIAGALGVGLGFGLQSIFNNFISGIILLFENQLKVGDSIELESGVSGEVKEINVRSTYVKTSDGIAIIVPNSEFINKRVVNWTLKDPYRRLHIPFSVAYDSDMDLVFKIVEEAASQIPVTLTQGRVLEPKVSLNKLGETGLELELAVWVDESASKRSGSTKSTYLCAILAALKKHNISIPLPQRDIHLKTIFGKTHWPQ